MATTKGGKRRTREIDQSFSTGILEKNFKKFLCGHLCQYSRFGTVRALPDLSIMIEKICREHELPLSFNQDLELLVGWLSTLRGGTYSPFHPTIAHYLRSEPDLVALDSALNEFVGRHEVLRTGFTDPANLTATESRLIFERIQRREIVESSLFTQRIHDEVRLNLSIRSAQIDSRNAADVAQLLSEEIHIPFRYDEPPLMRATLYRLKNSESLLQLVFHHLVCDRWSLVLLKRELSQLYNRFVERTGFASLPELPIQYVDFANWERKQVSNGSFASEIAYSKNQWNEYFPGRITSADLPFSQPDPSPRTEQEIEILSLHPDLCSMLRQCVRGHRITLSMLWLAATVCLLHLYSRKAKIALFLNFSNRVKQETRNLFGWCANSCLFGVSIDGGCTTHGLIDRIRQAALGAYSAQSVPLGALLPDLLGDTQEADLADTDLVSLDFIGSAEGWRDPLIEGLTKGPAPTPVVPTRAALQLVVEEKGSSLTADCIYPTNRFSREKVRNLLTDLITVVGELAKSTARPLADLQTTIRR